MVAAAVGRSAAAAGGRSVGTAENRLEKTKKKAAGAAAVFGLGVVAALSLWSTVRE